MIFNLFTHYHIIDNIYIGNACNAADYYTMKNLNITHIVNVSQEISNYFPEDFNYFKIKNLIMKLELLNLTSMIL